MQGRLAFLCFALTHSNKFSLPHTRQLTSHIPAFKYGSEIWQNVWTQNKQYVILNGKWYNRVTKLLKHNPYYYLYKNCLIVDIKCLRRLKLDVSVFVEWDELGVYVFIYLIQCETMCVLSFISNIVHIAPKDCQLLVQICVIMLDNLTISIWQEPAGPATGLWRVWLCADFTSCY